MIFLTLPVATITQTYAQQISDYQIVTKVEDIQAEPNIVLETRARCPKSKKVIRGGCFTYLFDSNLELIQAGPTPGWYSLSLLLYKHQPIYIRYNLQNKGNMCESRKVKSQLRSR